MKYSYKEKHFFMIPIKKAGIKQDENSLRLTLSKGIIFSLVGEGYTSQTCPACKTLNKPKGRNYVCECGYKTHRDIVGAFNILRKKYQCELVDFVMSYKHPIKVSYY